MRCMNIMSGLGIALIVVVGWSGVVQAQWTALTNAFPGHPDTCLLLTDGTVMCHEYQTNHWHLLTPDINGSYINGTWSNLADMPDGTDTSVANPQPSAALAHHARTRPSSSLPPCCPTAEWS